jgi:integrase
MLQEDAERFGLSQPERGPVLEDGTLIRGNRTKTNERYRVRIRQQLAGQLKVLGSPTFPGTYPKWRAECYKAFKAAGVKMTPHAFRHFRISEWLSQGGCALKTWLRMSARPRRKSVRRTTTGLRSTKIGLMTSSVRRGSNKDWMRTETREDNELSRIMVPGGGI